MKKDAKVYDEQLRQEVNAEREKLGKKPIEEDNDDEAPLKARRLSRVLLEGFLSCEQAGNIVVIHTMSGMANAVAAALDSLHMTEIVGTIAGDDTIFMAVRTIEDGKKLKQKVQELTS